MCNHQNLYNYTPQRELLLTQIFYKLTKMRGIQSVIQTVTIELNYIIQMNNPVIT